MLVFPEEPRQLPGVLRDLEARPGRHTKSHDMFHTIAVPAHLYFFATREQSRAVGNVSFFFARFNQHFAIFVIFVIIVAKF